MRTHGDITGQRMKSNHRDLRSPQYLDLWNSMALQVKVGIIIWRHPKYSLEANHENENDVDFFLKKFGLANFPLEVV